MLFNMLNLGGYFKFIIPKFFMCFQILGKIIMQNNFLRVLIYQEYVYVQKIKWFTWWQGLICCECFLIMNIYQVGTFRTCMQLNK